MLEEILRRMRQDAEADSLESLEAYMLLFSGHESEVGAAWRTISREGPPSRTLEQASDDVIALEALGDDARTRLTPQGEIARGGMGVVYEVRDEVLRRDLAMKKVTLASVPTEGSGAGSRGSLQAMPLLVRRLLEEAQVTAQLDHSGVVPVHELGIDENGHVYFTMKRVRGRTLAEVFELVRKGDQAWSLSRAIGVFLKVCQTLSYAHAKGVIHRDLKPANVMVGRFGEVYVMDWGLAKVQGREDTAGKDVQPKTPSTIVQTDQSALAKEHASAALTLQGDVIGTVGYMPPEQALGKLGELDARSDVYSIGAMLYELLAGHAPYREPERKRRLSELLLVAVTEAPKPLAACAPDAAPELVAIVDKAMATDPADRFDGAEALADELHAFLDGRVVRAYKTGPWIEVRKWVARNRALAIGVAATLLVFVGGIIAFAVQQRSAALAIGHERDLADQAAEDARAQQRRAEGLRLCAQSEVVVREDPALALALAYEGATRAPGAEANNALYGALRDHRLAHRLMGHESYVGLARFTRPDGRYLLSVDDVGLFILWDVETGRAVHWIDAEGTYVNQLEILEDGRLAVSLDRDGRVQLVDLEAGRVRHVLPVQAAPLSAIAVARDAEGTRVVVAGVDGEVSAWDPASGEKTATVFRHTVPPPRDENRYNRHVWLAGDGPDSSDVVSLGVDGVVGMHDLATGKVRWRKTYPAGALPEPSHVYVRFAARDHLVFRSPAGRLEVLDRKTGRVVHQLGDAAQVHHEAQVSGNGRRVVYRVLWGEEKEELWTTEIASGAVVNRIPWTRHRLFDVDHAGNHVLAKLGFNVRLHDLETGEIRMRLAGHAYRIRDAVFSADGRWIATASADRGVRVFQGQSPAERRGAVRRVRDRTRAYATSRDGSLVLLAPDDATSTETVFRVVDSLTGMDVYTLPVAPAVHLHAEFSADGRRLFQLLENGEVRIHAVQDGTTKSLGPVAPGSWDRRHGAARFSGDGTRLAVRRNPKRFDLYDLGTGDLLSTIGEDVTMSLRFAWSPDASLLAVCHGRDQHARIYDAQTGETTATLQGHTGYVLYLAWHPDGQKLVTTAVDSTVRVWDVRTGTRVAWAKGLPMQPNFVAIDPTGGYIAVTSKQIKLFRFDRSEMLVPHATLARDAAIDRIHFHPTASAFWTTSVNGAIRHWSLDAPTQARGRLVGRLSASQRTEFGLDPAGALDLEPQPGDGPAQLARAVEEAGAGAFDVALARIGRAAEARPTWARAPYVRAQVLGLRAQADGRDAADCEADRGACLAALEEATRLGWGRLIGHHLILSDPAFNPVRDDPRYRALLVTLGLTQRE